MTLKTFLTYRLAINFLVACSNVFCLALACSRHLSGLVAFCLPMALFGACLVSYDLHLLGKMKRGATAGRG